MDNYPDNIRQFDNDPRSPFYDDGGEELWVERRADELEKNIGELNEAFLEDTGEAMPDFLIEGGEQLLFETIHNLIVKASLKQAQYEWDTKDEL